MANVLTLTDDEIVVTKLQPFTTVLQATPDDTDGADEADADGTDGADGVDGEADADGTDV